MGFEFDEDMRADYAMASVSADEDVAMFVTLAIAASETAAIHGRIIAIVDGIQVDFDDSDLPGPFVSLSVEPGASEEAHVKIPARSIPDGAAHTLVVAIVSASSGRLVGGRTFSLFKNGFAFADRKDDSASARVSSRMEYIWAPWSNDVTLSLYQPFQGVDHDGASIPVDMTIQTPENSNLAACSDVALSIEVIALLDGKQVDIGDFGPFLRLVLWYGQSARVEAELRDLPLDGMPHVLTLLQYRGDGMYSETTSGDPLPWYDWSLVDLGFAYWQ